MEGGWGSLELGHFPVQNDTGRFRRSSKLPVGDGQWWWGGERGGREGGGGVIVTFQCSTTGDPLKARQEFLRVALFPGDDSGERGRRSLQLGHFLVQNDTRPFT